MTSIAETERIIPGLLDPVKVDLSYVQRYLSYQSESASPPGYEADRATPFLLPRVEDSPPLLDKLKEWATAYLPVTAEPFSTGGLGTESAAEQWWSDSYAEAASLVEGEQVAAKLHATVVQEFGASATIELAREDSKTRLYVRYVPSDVPNCDDVTASQRVRAAFVAHTNGDQRLLLALYIRAA